jgi:membrane protein DedA with SNARE-associated domain
MVFDLVVSYLVGLIDALGYVGIFFLMFLESSFFPFPSEVVIIPAGYLAFKGEMNLALVILFGILGSLGGAWFNYFLADRFGRKILLKFLRIHHLERVERFFERHGQISTFNGRLIPVVRQYISFPAGLAKMNGWKFSLYTSLGAGIWVSILAFLGYYLGQNEGLIASYLREITILMLVLVFLGSVVYVWVKRRKALVKSDKIPPIIKNRRFSNIQISTKRRSPKFDL